MFTDPHEIERTNKKILEKMWSTYDRWENGLTAEGKKHNKKQFHNLSLSLFENSSIKDSLSLEYMSHLVVKIRDTTQA